MADIAEEIDKTVTQLLVKYAEVNLSAWDNLRVLLSELALNGFQAEGFEVSFTEAKPHYWLTCAGVWLDCGRTNAYLAQIELLNDSQVRLAQGMKQQECALLSDEQITLLCMQNSHFDHC
ncbi:hypothetical protein K0H61_14155 [Shewanella acanthi]|nr:hypothetical protein K0H61_14155 [Shewanella acanthi]